MTYHPAMNDDDTPPGFTRHHMLEVGDPVDGVHRFECPRCTRVVLIGPHGISLPDSGDFHAVHDGATVAGLSLDTRLI